MKVLYATWVTEYDFGQRDEGVHFAENLEDLNATIKHTHSLGDRESFYRCSEPIIVHASPEAWAKYASQHDKVFWEKKLPEGFYKKEK